MISIIVPIYNVIKYMDICINTILAQTFTDFELILVDDGSTDGCSKLCDRYEEMDKRVKVIHQENSGLSAARNAGIKIAEGEFLTFIDSDDYIHKNMLQILWKNIEKEKAQISICGFQNVYEDVTQEEQQYKKDKKVYYKKDAVKRIVKYQEKNMIVAWGKLYRRELFKEIRFPIGKYHEDEFTTYKLFYQAEKIVVTTGKLYYYLQRNASIMGTGYSIKRLDKLEGLKESITYFREKNESEFFHLAQFRYLFNIQIAYYRALYEMKDNKKVLDKLEREYDKQYLESNIKKSSVISWQKRWLLTFFFRKKRIYCFLVRMYTKINRNLSQ